MKLKKKIGTTTAPKTHGYNTIETGNVWVGNMFTFHENVQNDPSFQELTVGAKNLASLIERFVPPGEKQLASLKSLSESYTNAASAIANGVVIPSSI